MKAERAASVAKKEANEEMRDFFKDKRRKLQEGCEKCSAPAPDDDADLGNTFTVTGDDGVLYEVPNDFLKN